jgi:GR25 family glycosyltransferase involved in LPS biosynthesis
MTLPSSWSDLCTQPVYMLGLQRYAFRRDITTKHLQSIGFTNIHHVEGIDGFQTDADRVLRQLDIQVDPTLGQGHKGFCASVLQMWKQMIEDDVPYRVFFEDDAIGHLDLPNGLGETFWKETPKSFDILYMGNMMYPADPVLSDPAVRIVKSPAYTTHAYMLTAKGVRTLWNLIRETNAKGVPLKMIDMQLVEWQQNDKLDYVCWNGTWIQKSFPTYDAGLPWQAFPNVILPWKDTGLFYQNMRMGTTLTGPTLSLDIPQYWR